MRRLLYMARIKLISTTIMVFILCAALAAASCISITPPQTQAPVPEQSTGLTQTPTSPFMSPLYLSVVIHVEEDVAANGVPKGNVPDYDGNENVFRRRR